MSLTQEPVTKSGVSQPMKAPQPIIEQIKKKDHWFVEVVSGYALSLTIVSSLTMFYTLLITNVFV